MEQRPEHAACDIMKSAVVTSLSVTGESIKTTGIVKYCEEPPSDTVSVSPAHLTPPVL